ncbi:MAG TPA: hypothetical protein VF678_04425 [bacterium]
MALAAAAALTLACTSPPQDPDLLHIQDDQFSVGDLSKDKAWATGIGCGGSDGDAVANAQKIAEYNLRNLTGAARYRVQYRILRRIPDKAKACVEVEAQAFSLRSR